MVYRRNVLWHNHLRTDAAWLIAASTLAGGGFCRPSRIADGAGIDMPRHPFCPILDPPVRFSQIIPAWSGHLRACSILESLWRRPPIQQYGRSLASCAPIPAGQASGSVSMAVSYHL